MAVGSFHLTAEKRTLVYYCLDLAVTCARDLNNTYLKGLFNRAFSQRGKGGSLLQKSFKPESRHTRFLPK